MDFSLHTRAIGASPSPTQQHSHVFGFHRLFLKLQKGYVCKSSSPIFLFQQSNKNGMAKMLTVLLNNLK